MFSASHPFAFQVKFSINKQQQPRSKLVLNLMFSLRDYRHPSLQYNIRDPSLKTNLIHPLSCNQSVSFTLVNLRMKGKSGFCLSHLPLAHSA